MESRGQVARGTATFGNARLGGASQSKGLFIKGKIMNRINVTLRGISPLLMNRMSDEQLLALHTKEKRKFTAPKEPREAAESRLYRTTVGAPYIPAENLTACLISAGMFIKLDGKRQLSTKQSTLLPAFLAIENAYVPLQDASGKEATWDVDMRQGRNPNGGEAVCIIRPRFDQWRMNVTLSIDMESISENVIRQLIDIAGSRIGLGDFRPQRRGVFGKFVVDQWEVA